MVEVKLVDGATVDLRRRIREGNARDQPVPFRDRVVHGEVRDAGRDRSGELLRAADHVPQNEDLVAADAALRLERAHDAVAAIDASDDLVRPLADRVADARL